jgi:hypothetical protein
MRVARQISFWVYQAGVCIRLYSFAKNSVSSVTRSRRREEVSRYTSGMSRNKIGRNDPCPCGSGKKYKFCCISSTPPRGAGFPQQFDLTTQTAYHEAGHVVFSTLHGPGVEIVTIDSQKVEELTGRKGCPGFTRYNEEGRLMEADKVLVATAVGLTSEAMFVTSGVVNPAEEDIGLLNDLLENQLGLHGEDKEREFIRVRLLTQAFVEENRAAIKSVAEALIERKTLTGEEIKQVLNP